ncbi:hypothetical protein Tco_0038106 [Tanacetum coccineum]
MMRHKDDSCEQAQQRLLWSHPFCGVFAYVFNGFRMLSGVEYLQGLVIIPRATLCPVSLGMRRPNSEPMAHCGSLHAGRLSLVLCQDRRMLIHESGLEELEGIGFNPATCSPYGYLVVNERPDLYSSSNLLLMIKKKEEKELGSLRKLVSSELYEAMKECGARIVCDEDLDEEGDLSMFEDVPTLSQHGGALCLFGDYRTDWSWRSYTTSEIGKLKRAKDFVTYCFNEDEDIEVKECGVRLVCDEDLDQEGDLSMFEDVPTLSQHGGALCLFGDYRTDWSW